MEICISTPSESSVSSKKTARNFFRFRTAKSISLLQFTESIYEFERKETKSSQSFKCCAITSGHSVPGLIPSSYHTRNPSFINRLIMGITLSVSL